MSNHLEQPFIQSIELTHEYKTRWMAAKAVLAERERELLELKGSCSTAACRLHYAHAGPCAVPGR